MTITPIDMLAGAMHKFKKTFNPCKYESRSMKTAFNRVNKTYVQKAQELIQDVHRTARGEIRVCYSFKAGFLMLKPDATNTLVVTENYALLEDALVLCYNPVQDRIDDFWFLPPSKLTEHLKCQMTPKLKGMLKEALKRNSKRVIRLANASTVTFSTMLQDGKVITQMSDNQIHVKLLGAGNEHTLALLVMYLDRPSFDLNIQFAISNPDNFTGFVKLKGIFEITEASKTTAGTIQEMDVKYAIHRLFLEMREKKDLDLDTATATILNAMSREVLDPSRKRKREIPWDPPKPMTLPTTAEDKAWFDSVWAS